MGINDSFWMQQAFDLALKARDEHDVPVGAILVDAHQNVIGRGYNQVLKTHDPTAHAEILALREAAVSIKNHRLNHTTLYVTMEPCSMCAGALVHARIARIVFATRDFKAGAAGSVYNLLQGYPLNHQVKIDEGVLQQECALLLTTFFKSRRRPVD